MWLLCLRVRCIVDDIEQLNRLEQELSTQTPQHQKDIMQHLIDLCTKNDYLILHVSTPVVEKLCEWLVNMDASDDGGMLGITLDSLCLLACNGM